jgi:SAM-dependent methyltransferase
MRLGDLRRGSRVLDVPCGPGRIANRLAAAGCHVIGIDANESFLTRAREEACLLGVDVQYVHGDMRSLPAGLHEFDLIVNWYSSFGYFDDEASRAMLVNWRAGLREHGRLVLDLANRDRLLRWIGGGGGEATICVERMGAHQIDRVTFNVITGRAVIDRTVVRESRVSKASYSVRHLTLPELREWLREAGFRSVRARDIDGTPFGLDSRRMVVVADLDPPAPSVGLR